MPECSLCAGPMRQEESAVLFTDYSGIPFEVCGECEKRFDALRESRSRPEIEAALGYISGHAESLANRGAYGLLMEYVAKRMPQPAEERAAPGFTGREEPAREGAAASPAEEDRPAGRWKAGLLIAAGVLLAAALLIVYAMGGLRF